MNETISLQELFSILTKIALADSRTDHRCSHSFHLPSVPF